MTGPQKTSLVGQHVGKYRVSRPIGRGGMGTIYEVIQDNIGHRAAIKVLKPQLAEHPKHDTYVARFLDEARAVNLIDHPGVVRIFDYGELPDKSIYIMMEYLDGETLARRIHRSKTDPRARLSIALCMEFVRQMASVMVKAHEEGVVHRDLKPDNLFLIKDSAAMDGERVKILDFGIAKFLDSAERRTTAGLAMGTPLYMSPEQCYGADSLDGKSDVYSLGAVLYAMLCGQPPFTGEPGQVMMHHVNTPLKSIGSRVFNLSPAAVALIDAMLIKESKRRPSMSDVVAQITLLAERGELPKEPPVTDPTKTTKGPEPSGPTVTLPPTASAVSIPPPTQTGITRTTRIGVGAVGLLAAGGALGALLGGRMQAPPPPLRCPPVTTAPATDTPAAPPGKAPAALPPASVPKEGLSEAAHPGAESSEPTAMTKLKKRLLLKKSQ